MIIRSAVLNFGLAAFLCMNLAACSGEANSEGNNGKAAADVENADKDRKEKEEQTPVEIISATTGDISSFILLSSNLETERMTDVFSRVQGLIARIEVEEGEQVKKGQLLMKLEPDELEFTEARARVEFEQEKNFYERKQKMFEKQLLSKEEFETAKFALQAKEIAWKKARLNLNHTQIRSPIDGVIGERLRRLGDRVQPSDKLFTVIDNEEMIAVIHVPEREIGLIKKGQKAFIKSQHLGNSQFDGWIKRVSPVVDPQSGTFKVTVGIRNEQDRLRPGMFVNVHVITDVHKNTVLIPKTALVYENDRMQVFVVRDNKAKRLDLDAGYQDYEKIESLSGIEPGEKVIVLGQAGLKDGASVNIVAEREITFGALQ